jgi:hypothetical protein
MEASPNHAGVAATGIGCGGDGGLLLRPYGSAGAMAGAMNGDGGLLLRPYGSAAWFALDMPCEFHLHYA